MHSGYVYDDSGGGGDGNGDGRSCGSCGDGGGDYNFGAGDWVEVYW